MSLPDPVHDAFETLQAMVRVVADRAEVQLRSRDQQIEDMRAALRQRDEDIARHVQANYELRQQLHALQQSQHETSCQEADDGHGDT